jgi:hypothetical protein
VWEKGDEDEEITSESDVEEGGSDSDGSGGGAGAAGEEEEEPETADQKRVRLAKEYIRRVRGDFKEQAGGGEDSGEDDDPGTHGAVASRLADDVLASRGDLQLAVAKQLTKVTLTSADVTLYRGHQVGVRPLEGEGRGCVGERVSDTHVSGRVCAGLHRCVAPCTHCPLQPTCERPRIHKK